MSTKHFCDRCGEELKYGPGRKLLVDNMWELCGSCFVVARVVFDGFINMKPVIVHEPSEKIPRKQP